MGPVASWGIINKLILRPEEALDIQSELIVINGMEWNVIIADKYSFFQS